MSASVTSALVNGNLAEALRSLVVIWQTTRNSKVADFVDRLSERVDTTELAAKLELPTVASYHPTWMGLATASAPSDLGPLLETMATNARIEHLTERFELLAKRHEDPRLASWIVAYVSDALSSRESKGEHEG